MCFSAESIFKFIIMTQALRIVCYSSMNVLVFMVLLGWSGEKSAVKNLPCEPRYIARKICHLRVVLEGHILQMNQLTSTTLLIDFFDGIVGRLLSSIIKRKRSSCFKYNYCNSLHR